MDKTEFDKYMDCILSMTLDVKMGKISSETYLNNMELIVKSIKEQIQ